MTKYVLQYFECIIFESMLSTSPFTAPLKSYFIKVSIWNNFSISDTNLA